MKQRKIDASLLCGQIAVGAVAGLFAVHKHHSPAPFLLLIVVLCFYAWYFLKE